MNSLKDFINQFRFDLCAAFAWKSSFTFRVFLLRSDAPARRSLRESAATRPTHSFTHLSSRRRASVCLTQTGGESCWVRCSYQDWAKCVTVLLKSTQAVPRRLSPSLPWALGVFSSSPLLSSPLPLSLPSFLSPACRIDPLNAFRTCRLTSCTCCFSSGVGPLGVQTGKSSWWIFFPSVSSFHRKSFMLEFHV